LYGTNPYGNPEVDPLKIQENFMDWWTIIQQCDAFKDFIGLDATPRNIQEQFYKL
jgi:hypothetical protein